MDDGLDIQAEILSALRRIIRAVDLHSKSLIQRTGLTGPQLVVLQCLRERGARTTGQIAADVSLGQATISEILERLERKGLVARTRSTADKRRVFTELTPKGLEATRTAPPLLQERFLAELLKLSDWEQMLILAMLKRVAEMMDAQRLDASPVLVSGPVGASTEDARDFGSTEPDTSSSPPRQD